MKCEYCEATDHLETSCPTRAADRRKEVILAVFFLVLMSPAWILGTFLGLCWSSFTSAFKWMDGMWPQTWKAIRGVNKDERESNSP